MRETTHFFIFFLYVCVCVREREREQVSIALISFKWWVLGWEGVMSSSRGNVCILQSERKKYGLRVSMNLPFTLRRVPFSREFIILSWPFVQTTKLPDRI